MSSDDEGFSINDLAMSHDMLGISCPHALEAVHVGTERLKRLKDSGASDEALRAEFAATDPLVKAYYFIGFQRALWMLTSAMRGAFPVLSQVDIFGHGPFNQLPVTSEAFGKVFDDSWNLLNDIFWEFKDALEERVNHLHEKHEDGSKTLVPWNYPDSPTEKPVELTETQAIFSDMLLKSIFGD